MIQQPDIDQITARLAPLSQLLGSVLPKAAAEVAEYFKAKAKPYNASAFSTLVRYEARLLLQSQYLVDDDGDEHQIRPHDLSNIGLALIHDAISVRILKACANGKLPVPQSEARIEFYNQQQRFEFDVDTGSLVQTTGNVIYMWDSNPSYEITSLRLVWPKSGGLRRESVHAHFDIPIPLHEAGEYVKHRREASDQRSDLDISLPQAESEVGTNEGK